MASGDISQWVKDARAWTAATKANAAGGAFATAGLPPEVQEVARQISNLHEGMRYGAEDVADQYDARTAAARQAMMDKFANTDATVQAGYQNSQNYMSEIANRLGLGQVLQGPGVESQNQQMNQVMALNNANRTNQMASYDLLKGGYGELLRDRIGSYDVQAGMSLANLLSQLQAAKAAAGSGGGGGRGGGGSSSGGVREGFDFPKEQMAYIAINPENPPSGSTYSSDYVRPDVGRGSIGWKPQPLNKKQRPMASNISRITATKSGARRPLSLRSKAKR